MIQLIDLPEEVLHHIFTFIPEQDVFWTLGFCCLRLQEVVLNYVKHIELQVPLIIDDERMIIQGSKLSIPDEVSQNNNEMQSRHFEHLTSCHTLMRSVRYIAIGKIKSSLYEEEIFKDIQNNNDLYCSNITGENHRYKVVFMITV